MSFAAIEEEEVFRFTEALPSSIVDRAIEPSIQSNAQSQGLKQRIVSIARKVFSGFFLFYFAAGHIGAVLLCYESLHFAPGVLRIRPAPFESIVFGWGIGVVCSLLLKGGVNRERGLRILPIFSLSSLQAVSLAWLSTAVAVASFVYSEPVAVTIGAVLAALQFKKFFFPHAEKTVDQWSFRISETVGSYAKERDRKLRSLQWLETRVAFFFRRFALGMAASCYTLSIASLVGGILGNRGTLFAFGSSILFMGGTFLSLYGYHFLESRPSRLLKEIREEVSTLDAEEIHRRYGREAVEQYALLPQEKKDKILSLLQQMEEVEEGYRREILQLKRDYQEAQKELSQKEREEIKTIAVQKKLFTNTTSLVEKHIQEEYRVFHEQVESEYVKAVRDALRRQEIEIHQIGQEG